MSVTTRRWMMGSTLAVSAAALALSTVHIQKYRYRPYLHEALYLPSGRFVQELSLGYRELVADFVWFSTVQYYGDYRHGNHNLAYFRSLIDIITGLDPRFTFAYLFGALVICEDIGSFDEGIDILKRGMSHNPTAWELPFEIGFLHFIHHVDLTVAAQYFDLASRIPGAPERTERFAAYVYSQAGDAASSVEVWERYKELTNDPFLKALAERYIEKLRAEESGRGVRDDGS